MADTANPATTHPPAGSEQPAATRRDFLDLVTWATLAVGAGALAWPLIDQMNPSADVLALSSIEVDLSPIEVGQRVVVKWRGKPVFVSHRTDQEIQEAEAVPLNELRDPQADQARAQKAPWLIVVGVCTHLGCVPLGTKEGEPRRLWRLVLPLPRLALRHRRPHPQRPGTFEPAFAAICLPDRHLGPDRLEPHRVPPAPTRSSLPSAKLGSSLSRQPG